MKSTQRSINRPLLLILVISSLTGLSTGLRADTATCGGQTITIPFDDVSPASNFFCAIAEAFFSGLTNGTTPTTFSPGDPVPREQMAAFVTRTLDQSIKRGHTRAALGQWWTDKTEHKSSTDIIGNNPRFLACDGLTVWSSNTDSNSLSRIDTRTGDLICTLSGIPLPEQIVVLGRDIYIASFQSPGRIYSTRNDKMSNTPIGSALSFALGTNPVGMTFDGQNMWTANVGTGPGTGSLSRISFNTGITTTFTTGLNQPFGIVFDGANLWVTDQGDTSLKRIDTTTGSVLQTTPLSGLVQIPVFDGANLWIPCAGIAQLSIPDRVYVVRAAGGLQGTVLAQLTGNGLAGVFQAAFDGERICVTNTKGHGVSLWKATDLSPIAFAGTRQVPGENTNPRGVCSDGTTFFIGVRREDGGDGFIARF